MGRTWLRIGDAELLAPDRVARGDDRGDFLPDGQECTLHEERFKQVRGVEPVPSGVYVRFQHAQQLAQRLR